MRDSRLTLQRLVASAEAVAAVQSIVEAAPEYSVLTTGADPLPNAAASIFEALPPGKTFNDKYVLAVCLDEMPVGVVDLIRGFPSPDTAMLGLLLLSERHQRSGLGRAAYALVERLVDTWSEVRRMRIGVVESNAKVLPYWQRMGFSATGESKPHAAGQITSRVIVLERQLADRAPLNPPQSPSTPSPDSG